MTNRDRILALIRNEPGLTDAEIRVRTGIEPHQQVNQICRALAVMGLTERVDGPDGRIVNVPRGRRTEAEMRTRRPSAPARRAGSPAARQRLTNPATVEREVMLERSLIVIPCSGKKAPGNAAATGLSVLDALPHDLAGELTARRLVVAREVGIDESTLLPAVDRYAGTLYARGRPGIRSLLNRGAAVVIISGGYGLVLAGEPIGRYDQEFRPRLWPDQIIQRCLAGLASRTGVRQVIGALSASTDYARVFRSVSWPSTVDQVVLATPRASVGAMVRAPGAEGEWLAQLASAGRIPAAGWSSSDGVRMEMFLR